MRFASIAEVKNRLSVYLAQARKKGEPIVVTHHGKPYALIQPISERDLEQPPTPAKRATAVIRRLEAAGVLRPASRTSLMPPWAPRRIRGAPLSATVSAERSSA